MFIKKTHDLVYLLLFILTFDYLNFYYHYYFIVYLLSIYQRVSLLYKKASGILFSIKYLTNSYYYY
jgi:hypothetical protein